MTTISDTTTAPPRRSEPANAHRWPFAVVLVLVLIMAFAVATQKSGELRLGLALVMGPMLIVMLWACWRRAQRLPPPHYLPFSQTVDGCVVGPAPAAFSLAVGGVAAMMMIGAVLVVHLQFSHPDVLRGSASGRLVGYSILVALGAPYVLYRGLVTAVQRPRLSIGQFGVSCGRKAIQWSAVGDFEIMSPGRRLFTAKIRSADGKTQVQFVVFAPDTPEGQVIEQFVTRFWGRPPSYPNGRGTPLPS